MVQSLLVEEDGEQQLEFAKFVFPVFPALPLPLTSEDWSSALARNTLTCYMNIIGWKVGGNSYTDKTNIPPGWPNCMDYKEFKGPSAAKTWEVKIILRSLLIHHGFDPDVHHVPVTENNNNNKKKRRTKKSRSQTSAPIIEETEDEERRIEGQVEDSGQETGDADRNEDEKKEDDEEMNEDEDRRENVPEYRRENVPEDRREGTAPGEVIGGENTAPRVVTVAAVEAARIKILHGAVDDVNMSLPTISVDRIDPGADITWPIAINPGFFKNYPSKSQMRSWPWPSTSSTPPHSDAEESAYEKLQRENIKEKEKRLAELEIASEIESVKKPRKRNTKTSSSEPIRKSRRLADKR